MQQTSGKTLTHLRVHNNGTKLRQEKILWLRPKQPTHHAPGTAKPNSGCNHHRKHPQHQNPTTSTSKLIRRKHNSVLKDTAQQQLARTASTHLPNNQCFHKQHPRIQMLDRTPRQSQIS